MRLPSDCLILQTSVSVRVRFFRVPAFLDFYVSEVSQVVANLASQSAEC
jgi:hypothetical protein